MADFVPDEFDPPVGVTTPQFWLEPLGPQHDEADYASWTSSMQHIRDTPGFATGSWPHKMTIDQNRDPGDLPQQPVLVGDKLQSVDTHHGVRCLPWQRRIRSISEHERRSRAGHECFCSSRRLGDRTGREIDPTQTGTGHARKPQADPATTAAQVDEMIAWFES
jgi:hypothetical protein